MEKYYTMNDDGLDASAERIREAVKKDDSLTTDGLIELEASHRANQYNFMELSKWAQSKAGRHWANKLLQNIKDLGGIGRSLTQIYQNAELLMWRKALADKLEKLEED